MAPRLVRRRPLSERIKSFLDPIELLLWLSEKFESSEWDVWGQQWALPIGIFLNLLFLIARANSGLTAESLDDGVFGDEDGRIRWSAWFSAFVVHSLVVLAFANATYTFWRRRHYRLFEKSVNAVPSTPSAKRVRVNSSPVSSSPLRYLSSVLAGDNAESRAHPNEARDVWEITVWDPTPIALNLFCFLSPGHALVYLSFLPTANSDPRPSTTVATAIFLGLMLSIQLYALRSNFSQQSKDASLIHKEVMNEYDTKFVHPRTQHMMRDVGTQYSSKTTRRSGSPTYEVVEDEVDTHAPTFIINKGFHTHPNPSYLQHIDPDNAARNPITSRARGTSTAFQTPSQRRDTFSPSHFQVGNYEPQIRSPVLPGDGGSLGVYSHANSPFRKSTSSSHRGTQGHREKGHNVPRYRASSPLKRNSIATYTGGIKPD